MADSEPSRCVEEDPFVIVSLVYTVALGRHIRHSSSNAASSVLGNRDHFRDLNEMSLNKRPKRLGLSNRREPSTPAIAI